MAPRTLIDEQDETIETAVAALLDVAVAVRQTGSTAIVHCDMCGERDENHTGNCPVPLLEQWLFDAVKVRPEERAAMELWTGKGFMPM